MRRFFRRPNRKNVDSTGICERYLRGWKFVTCDVRRLCGRQASCFYFIVILEDRAIEKSQRVNEQIRVPQVRVIGADGAQLGVLDTAQAMTLAREAELDLVEVAPTERPPVCRIMDFGKFKYQQNKRQHKNHAHQTKIKEIRLRPKTDAHDLETKTNHAREFLADKNKVVISVVFKGREVAHMEEGRKVVEKMIKSLEDIGKLEGNPSTMGKRIICTMSPR